MGFGAPLTGFSANAAAAETTLLPPYNSVAIDSFPATAAVMKSDSGITYNLPIPRKRARDQSSMNQFVSYPYSPAHSRKNCGCSTDHNNFYFLGEDFSIQIQQQQFDLDRLISLHMEKVRVEVEEKRRKHARRIVEAIELGMMRILRSKEAEIEKIGKLNYELEERVNSLCMENQLWRDVAQTNEATANALRSNLEQVLSVVEVKNEEVQHGGADEAESCCGGNNYEEDDRKRKDRDRRCRNCWKEESCVLLLPCRHLCLCTVCGSSLQTCPICNSTNNASVRVIIP